MNTTTIPYRIFSLGDAALTIDFGNRIDEAINNQVVTLFHHLQQYPLPGMIEAVPAYSTITIHYNVHSIYTKITTGHTVFEYVEKQLQKILEQPVQNKPAKERVVKIPVCYEDEFATDLNYLAATKNISIAEVIQIHTSKKYKVFMLGFLPGFSYMGEVDEKIAIARKPQPVNVIAGSVGIAGKQTGIYPLASPGGWQIIGRTPVKLFDATKEEPTLLSAGDMVQFYSISKNEFEEITTTEAQQH
jgi:inhibitor of KinA